MEAFVVQQYLLFGVTFSLCLLTLGVQWQEWGRRGIGSQNLVQVLHVCRVDFIRLSMTLDIMVQC